MDLSLIYESASFVGGLTALIVGGQLLLRGAIGLGQILQVSPLFLGLSLVAFGTSAPEIFVIFQAASQGEPDLALGNVVGSNIANILLVLGLAAIIVPVTVRAAMVFRDGIMMLATAVLFVWIAQSTDLITRFHGVILFGVLAMYLLLVFVYEQVSDSPTGDRIRDSATRPIMESPSWMLEAFYLIGGVLLLSVGSHFLVEGAAAAASRLGVTEAVIGLSVLAIGTSLPELVTGLMAAARRQFDILIGNVLGSCTLNVLAALGLTALFQPISINVRIAELDMWIMLAATIILVPFMITNWRLSRAEGALLLIGFIVYMAALYSGIGLT